jgi:predicted phosphatase
MKGKVRVLPGDHDLVLLIARLQHEVTLKWLPVAVVQLIQSQHIRLSDMREYIDTVRSLSIYVILSQSYEICSIFQIDVFYF